MRSFVSGPADASGVSGQLPGPARVIPTERARLPGRAKQSSFRDFTSKPIADAKQTTEVLSCLSEDRRAAVDGTTENAIAAGGKAGPCPKQDYGFMYGRSFEDPDGHIFKVM